MNTGGLYCVDDVWTITYPHKRVYMQSESHMSGDVQICVVLVSSSGQVCMYMTFTLIAQEWKSCFPNKLGSLGSS